MYLKNKENICKIYININKDINKYNKENIYVICFSYFYYIISLLFLNFIHIKL